MRISPFNEDQKNFIRENYEELSAGKIAGKLGVTKYHVCNFVASEGIKKTNLYAPKAPVESEFFNVNKRDWFI